MKEQLVCSLIYYDVLVTYEEEVREGYYIIVNKLFGCLEDSGTILPDLIDKAIVRDQRLHELLSILNPEGDENVQQGSTD